MYGPLVAAYACVKKSALLYHITVAVPLVLLVQMIRYHLWYSSVDLRTVTASTVVGARVTLAQPMVVVHAADARCTPHLLRS
jgi:hypothetical protein